MTRLNSMLPYLIAAISVIAAAYLGLTTALGAHPFWSVSVAWIGVPIGLLLALLGRTFGLRRSLQVLVFLIGLTVAFAVASLAKERFAASFADDALAGRFWHFGWIAITAFAAAMISALISLGRDRKGA